MLKRMIHFFVTLSFLFLCNTAIANEGVLKASPDKSEQIESWLHYATSAKTGTGNKTIFVFCNIECPRCARFSDMVTAMPEDIKKDFEFRWVLYGARDIGLLYPLDNPTSSITEAFKEQKPRPIIDEQAIMMGTTYNAVIGGRTGAIFPSSSSDSWKYTPVFIFKTDDGFEKRSLESLAGQPMEKIFSRAQHVQGKELVPLLKQVFTDFQTPRSAYFTVNNTAQLRLLPVDDSPILSVLEAGFTVSPVAENDQWISVKMQGDIPFAFIKKTEGKFE